MEFPLIVAFQTCNRAEYTARTLCSFKNHNRLSDWLKFYADDASDDQVGMRRLVEQYGFEPVVLNTKREGIGKTASCLMEEVARRVGHATVLYLQNDFESMRRIPLNVVEKVFSDPRVGWLRTAGEWKDPGRERMIEDWASHCVPPCRNWTPTSYDGEEIEIGRSYFCHNPPPLASLEVLLPLMKDASSELESTARAARLPFLTARFKTNIVRHIGVEQTGRP